MFFRKLKSHEFVEISRRMDRIEVSINQLINRIELTETNLYLLKDKIYKKLQGKLIEKEINSTLDFDPLTGLPVK